MSTSTRALIEKIETLPPDRLAEVDDFVDFICLRERERALIRAAAATSLAVFAAVWNNPEDDVYDALLNAAPSSLCRFPSPIRQPSNGGSHHKQSGLQ